MGDAFVTASVTEVHPLTVIEAMASGLPVLGIQSPGVGDTIQEGVTGFLAPQEDLAMFTAKMVKLLWMEICDARWGKELTRKRKTMLLSIRRKSCSSATKR